MIDITPKPDSRFGRVAAYLRAWDDAIHADPTERLAAHVRKLEARIARLDAQDEPVNETG